MARYFFRRSCRCRGETGVRFFGAGQEDRGLARRRLGQQAPVILNCLQRRLADGNQAFLLALAAHAHQALVPVNVLGHQPAKLADAQAAGINGLQHGHVAPAGKGRGRPVGIRLALRRQELERGGQQIGHLLRRQEFGQPFAELRQGEVLDRRSSPRPHAERGTGKRSARRRSGAGWPPGSDCAAPGNAGRRGSHPAAVAPTRAAAAAPPGASDGIPTSPGGSCAACRPRRRGP